jgi:hypothetical protein
MIQIKIYNEDTEKYNGTYHLIKNYLDRDDYDPNLYNDPFQ